MKMLKIFILIGIFLLAFESVDCGHKEEKLEFPKKYGREEEKCSAELPEKYIPKILIKGEWGKKETQFGIFTKATTNGVIDSLRGPVAMDVDRNGNIYIFDPVNWRVAIYSSKGIYKSIVNLEKEPEEITPDYGFKGGYSAIGGGRDEIRIDSKGDIYLHTADDGHYLLRKYDRSGKLINYYITKRLKNLYSRNSGYNRYFKKLEELNKLVEVDDLSMADLFPSEYIFLDGYLDSSLSLIMSSNYRREKKVKFYKGVGGLGIYSPGIGIDLPRKAEAKVREFFETSDEHPKYSILIIDENGNFEKGLKIEEKGAYYFHPLKEDINGNVYVYVCTRSFEGKNVYRKNWIYKYDYQGNLISIIEVLNRRIPFISWNGEIYQIFWEGDRLNEGFQIIKWEKK